MDSGMHPQVPPPHTGWWALPRLATNTATAQESLRQTMAPCDIFVTPGSHPLAPRPHASSTLSHLCGDPHHTAARNAPACCIRLLRLSISLMEMVALGCGGSQAPLLLLWHLPAPWLPCGARGRGGGLNSPALCSPGSRESTGSGWGGTGAHWCLGHPGQGQPMCLSQGSGKAVLVVIM